MPTVREFIRDTYRLISANSPTVPLHGDDMSLGIRILNELLQSYASTGLKLTIAKTVNVPVIAGQQNVVCGPVDYVPTPDITTGRLAHLLEAWVELDDFIYPLRPITTPSFLEAFKYEPLQSLPRYAIIFMETEVTRIRLYPAPSQAYEFYARGKFELNELTANDDMSAVPKYYIRYLKLAAAKDIAMHKGRSEAWTDKLEDMLMKESDIIDSTSEFNMEVESDRGTDLNGAYRVRAGV